MISTTLGYAFTCPNIPIYSIPKYLKSFLPKTLETFLGLNTATVAAVLICFEQFKPLEPALKMFGHLGYLRYSISFFFGSHWCMVMVLSLYASAALDLSFLYVPYFVECLIVLGLNASHM